MTIKKIEKIRKMCHSELYILSLNLLIYLLSLSIDFIMINIFLLSSMEYKCDKFKFPGM
jgi:hypothetical protein